MSNATDGGLTVTIRMYQLISSAGKGDFLSMLSGGHELRDLYSTRVSRLSSRLDQLFIVILQPDEVGVARLSPFALAGVGGTLKEVVREISMGTVPDPYRDRDFFQVWLRNIRS